MKLLKIKVNKYPDGLNDEIVSQAIPYESIRRIIQSVNGKASIIVEDNKQINTENDYADIVDRLGWYELDKTKLVEAQLILTNELITLTKAATKFFTCKEYQTVKHNLTVNVNGETKDISSCKIEQIMEMVAEKYKL
jgi:hypothetical protein